MPTQNIEGTFFMFTKKALWNFENKSKSYMKNDKKFIPEYALYVTKWILMM